MKEEKKIELASLCRMAANGIVSKLCDTVISNLNKQSCPQEWIRKGLSYSDYLSFRLPFSSLSYLGSAYSVIHDDIKEQINRLSDIELFTLSCYVISMRIEVTNCVNDILAGIIEVEEEELIRAVVQEIEDRLLERFAEVISITGKNASIFPIRMEEHLCPNCGGKLLSVRTCLEISNGDLMNKMMIIDNRAQISSKGVPVCQCAKCAFQYYRKD